MTVAELVLQKVPPLRHETNAEERAMSVSELLAALAALDVRLWIDGDQLRLDAPKGALTPDLLKVLKASKAEVIALLAASEGHAFPATKEPVANASTTNEDYIQPVDRAQSLQLSSAQERLWQLEQLNPGTSLYNITEALRLQGELDSQLLAESIRQVVARHEVLRTAFRRNADGGAEALVSEAIPNNILELRQVNRAPQSKMESMLRATIDAEAQRVFDLSEAPLLRCVLLVIDERDHLLIVTMHHMISDALSFAIFMDEVSGNYAALQKGLPTQLSALPLQYSDYAGWQRQSLQNGDTKHQRQFWEAKLGDALQPLHLPTDLARYATNYEADRQRVAFDGELSEKLRGLARQEKVTMFVLLLTAFQTLLNRYSGQEDLLVCAPVSGRNRVALENLIGYFNNILVLRSDLSGNPTFRELLRRVRTVVLEASDRQDVPFAEVAGLPKLRRVPLNRALFELREVGAHSLHLPGVIATPMVVEKGSSDFDLFLILYEREGELSCVVHSKNELFSRKAIQQLLEDFQQLLAKIVADPNRAIGELPEFVNDSKHDAKIDLKAETYTLKAASESLVLQLTQIWQQVLALKSIQPTDNFFELGGHSLLAVQLVAEIERQLVGEKLPLAMVLQAPTIAQMADVLAGEGWRSSWSSLVPIQPKGTKPPLFFVHAHGGNVIGYHDLARHLGDDQPFYGLQAMGMASAEKVKHRLEEMAAHYISEIRTLQPHGPYQLGGWCLGGDVAYEMAQQLQAQGEEVALLVMVHNPQPGFPRYLPTNTRLQRKLYHLLARIDREWCNFKEVKNLQKPGYLLARWRDMLQMLRIKAERRLDWLFRRFALTHSTAYQKELLADAHLKAYADYHPEPYTGNVMLIRAQKQPLGTENDSALGWDRLITGKLTICEVPGYPIGLLDEPRVKQVASHLLNFLNPVNRR